MESLLRIISSEIIFLGNDLLGNTFVGVIASGKSLEQPPWKSVIGNGFIGSDLLDHIFLRPTLSQGLIFLIFSLSLVEAFNLQPPPETQLLGTHARPVHRVHTCLPRVWTDTTAS